MSALKHSLVILAALTALAGCHGSEAVSTTVRKALASSPETLVNTTTALDQQLPAISSNDAGNAVVVWESLSTGASYYDVFARRFQNGAPAGPAFRVNTYTDNRQSLPAVAMDAAGNFVVTWRSSLQQGNGGTIYAQRFLSSGAPAGAEFQVGPADSDYDSQSEPGIAMSPSGTFVIVWSNRELSEAAVRAGQNNVETRTIQGRLYAADGSSVRGPFDVMEPTPLSIVRAPSVAMDGTGAFAVAWISESNPAGVRLRQFDATGRGNVTQTVSEARDDAELDQPALAMNQDGDFVVAWEAVFYGDGLPDGIYFKRYSKAAGSYGSEKRVGGAAAARAQPSGSYERVSLALNSQGDLLVAAQGNDAVQANVYDISDNVTGVLAVSNPAFAALSPAVSMSNNGRAVLTWQSFDQDGDGRGIYFTDLAVR